MHRQPDQPVIAMREKKIAWIDCSSGAAGNMLLGALIDLGFPQKRLRQMARAFKLGNIGFEVSRKTRAGIAGVLVKITPRDRQRERNFSQIKKIISAGAIPSPVREKAIETFLALAKAEAKVHGASVERVHFHELGAVDTIIDIVGVTWGFHELGVESIFAGPLRLGAGEVRCSHGILPVPAPATLELVRGLPVFGGDQDDGELTTPTGAVLVRSLASSFGPVPEMVPEKTGCGLGERDLGNRPNLLRIVLGKGRGQPEQAIQIETTIDDMNPEFFSPLLQALTRAGALETALVPAQLKKDRPGAIVRVLCKRPDLEKIIRQMFLHSTTTGLRYYPVDRVCLPRKIIKLKTRFGELPAKIIALPDRGVRVHPEYESMARLSRKWKIPLIELEQEVKLEWLKKPARKKS